MPIFRLPKLNFSYFFNHPVRKFTNSSTPLTKLRASFQCPREDRMKFKQSHAQLTISVGSRVHEGERLESTIDLINNSFQQCTIMLDDSLQWPTLGLGHPHLDNQELLTLAIKNGDQWLEEERNIYTKLEIPYKIVRWKDWISSPVFSQAIERMQVLYDTNIVIQQAINNNIELFLDRYGKNTQTDFMQDKRAIELCTRYLIEECAIMYEFWPTLQTHYEVYPSKRSPAMSAVYTLLIQPKFPDLLKPVALRFERRNIEILQTEMTKTIKL